VLLIGQTREEIGASEYLAACHGEVAGAPPRLDLDEAARLVEFLVTVARAGLPLSAHDCSDGGLAVALAECSILATGGPLGLEATVESETSVAATLFGESQSRVVMSCDPSDTDAIIALAATHDLPAARLGTVREAGDRFVVRAGERTIDLAPSEMGDVYDAALPRRMQSQIGLTG
jgi:phosphoribosylformylglycinamidine synthase